MADQVLERFHRALIEEIQTQRPEYLTQPFTVAEIYQNLVPYGSHRDRIGVEMNGDYEDALVRLLAGEGGYLILDSEPALENLRAELDAPNPNTGVYREFAAVDVRLNQAYLDLSAEAMDQLPDLYEELEAEDPMTMTELAPAEGMASAEDLGVVPPGVDIFGDNGPSAKVAGDDGPPLASTNGPGGGGEKESEDQTGTEAVAGEEGAAGGGDVDVDERADDPFESADAPDAGESSPAVEATGDPEGDATDAVESEPESEAPVPASQSRRPPLAPEFVEDALNGPAEAGQKEGAPAPADAGSRPPPDGACLWCRADLPEREDLAFCPFCGTDVSLIPCPSCGAEIEADWRFCAACGTEADR